MADPISIGASAAGGIFNAMGAATKAQGEKNAIQGQMLGTIGKAFQFDMESKSYVWKSNVEEYQAAVARNNKIIAQQNAGYERDVGELTASDLALKQRKDRGDLIAAQGASGIDVNSKSSQAVRAGMIDVGWHEQQVTRANAAHVAYGYDVQATQFEAEAAIHSTTAEMDRLQADTATTAANITRMALPLQEKAMDLASTAGGIGVMSSLTGAAGSVAGKWMQSSFQGMGSKSAG
jgi:hypothetical protein